MPSLGMGYKSPIALLSSPPSMCERDIFSFLESPIYFISRVTMCKGEYKHFSIFVRIVDVQWSHIPLLSTRSWVLEDGEGFMSLLGQKSYRDKCCVWNVLGNCSIYNERGTPSLVYQADQAFTKSFRGLGFLLKRWTKTYWETVVLTQLPICVICGLSTVWLVQLRTVYRK